MIQFGLKLKILLLSALSPVLLARAEPTVEIRTDFAGGNGIVLKNEDAAVHLEPDHRGDRPWFYWMIEAKSLRAGEVTFVLPEKVIGHQNGAIGPQGPAISRDAGKSWGWMGTEQVSENTFTITFDEAGEKIRLGSTIPYTTADLRRFLESCQGNPNRQLLELTRSPKGQSVELIRIGEPDASRSAVLVTARHHACETMASFVLEGFLEEAMSEDGVAGREFRERHILFCVPLVDKDGVEAGDQGKNRKPHDHNRDYTSEPIYPEVAAIQQLHEREKFAYAIDFHCPTLVYGDHQVMYFVGARIHPPKNFEKVSAFAKEIKTRLPENAPHGPLVWLRDELKPSPKNSRWFAFRSGVVMSATLEIPFAPKGKNADVESCRAYGRSILRAFVATPFEEIGPAQSLEIQEQFAR